MGRHDDQGRSVRRRHCLIKLFPSQPVLFHVDSTELTFTVLQGVDLQQKNEEGSKMQEVTTEAKDVEGTHDVQVLVSLAKKEEGRRRRGGRRKEGRGRKTIFPHKNYLETCPSHDSEIPNKFKPDHFLGFPACSVL